jgi:cytochrome bd ubiquinol oxidase subunit II
VAAIVAMECGWVVTEVGRQPWVVYHLQTTAQAATTNGGVVASLTIVIIGYAVLGVATIVILRTLARRWRLGGQADPAVPYGPPGQPGRAAGRIMIADTVGAILLATVTLYAVFGGADFGGGLWDLLAGGAQRGRGPRALIEESITPVWEGNHVWLVFALVIFWTAFPGAFASVMTVLALPLWLAVLGIVLRGAGFAFRKEVTSLALQRLFGATFALSSLLTPFFMGAAIGGIAASRVPASGGNTLPAGKTPYGDSLAAWTSPTSILIGLLFVGACAYLAAVYLTGEAAKRGDERLRVYFTRRAQAAGVVTGALSLAALAELHGSDPGLFHHLTGRALALVIVAAVTGLAVLVLLSLSRPERRPTAAGRLRWVRPLAALGVAAVIWGWGVAQYPALLPGTSVTLANGAPHDTQVAIVVVFAAAVVLVGPSFGLLFALHGRQVLTGGDADQDSAG